MASEIDAAAFEKFEEWGEDVVRLKLRQGSMSPLIQSAATHWLSVKDEEARLRQNAALFAELR